MVKMAMTPMKVAYLTPLALCARYTAAFPPTRSVGAKRVLSSMSGQLSVQYHDSIGGEGITLSPDNYSKVVVFMHGLGDTAMGWFDVMNMLEIPDTKYILPTAPHRPITLNMGMQMPGWYDIRGLSASSREDETGVYESELRITDIIKSEVDQGINSESIAVCGFSQGGAVALHVSLRSQVPLAGCVALSTYLPLRDQYPDALGPHVGNLSVLQCHGVDDEVVRYDWGRGSHDSMTNDFGMTNVEWKEYRGLGHGANLDEIEDVAAFLNRVLSK